jgi:hypothetical protein
MSLRQRLESLEQTLLPGRFLERDLLRPKHILRW